MAQALGHLGLDSGLAGSTLLNANEALHKAAQAKIQGDHATALSVIHADNADALVKLVKMKEKLYLENLPRFKDGKQWL